MLLTSLGVCNLPTVWVEIIVTSGYCTNGFLLFQGKRSD